MKIRLELQEGDTKLKWRDIEAVESQKLSLMRPIIARYMVDEEGNRLDIEQASEILLDLDWDEMSQVSDAFLAFVKEATVNPQTAAS